MEPLQSHMPNAAFCGSGEYFRREGIGTAGFP